MMGVGLCCAHDPQKPLSTMYAPHSDVYTTPVILSNLRSDLMHSKILSYIVLRPWPIKVWAGPEDKATVSLHRPYAAVCWKCMINAGKDTRTIPFTHKLHSACFTGLIPRPEQFKNYWSLTVVKHA